MVTPATIRPVASRASVFTDGLRIARSAVLVALALFASARTARAQDDAPSPTPITPAVSAAAASAPTADDERVRLLEQRLEELDQRHRILERKLELKDEKADEKSRLTPLVSAAPGKGFTIALPDERFSANLRLRVQLRDTILAVPDGAGGHRTTNEINLKTIRLWLTGNVLVPELRYGVQLAFGGNDFEAGSSSPLFDAFLEYTRLRDLNIKVGQFFVPFDRLRTVRESALEMVDRPQPITELTLDRDVGVSFSSQDLFGTRGILAYNVSIFGGEGRNRFGGQAMGGLYVLRLGVRPFGAFDDDSEGDLTRLPRPRLAIGLAGAYNQGTNRQRSTTGATLTYGTVDYAHAAADLVFKHSGFYFAGEVVYRQGLQDSLEGMKDGMPAKEWSRSGWGYITQASMMVHEKVQLTARWAQMFALPLTDPTWVRQVADLGHEVGGGFNIYLNGHAFKIQTDYFYLFGDEPRMGRHQARIQLDSTF